ncbi:MAG TPA: prepilin-type N-terminal cleavage/methylation domain-containing protein [Candidatus Dormibacteraeota bacterium]|nr:prepilin-type N-terminal cleavage/methylation domain-containing protein [Candidatus Dormibacteraeota bacterium]
MKQQTNATRGFSMVEVMISMVVMVVIMAATIIEMEPVIQQMHANAAADLILGQLRTARQLSIAKRRDIQVQFIGNNEIKLTQEPIPGVAGGPVVLSDLFLSPTVFFMQFGGMPDTPDGFGNAGAVDFGGVVGGPPIMQFQSNGTFVDANGIPMNGSVFIGVANIPTTARAITVLGTTGRIRLYKGSGTGWLQ